MYQQRIFTKRLGLFPLAIVLFVFGSHCFAASSDSTLYTNAQVYTLNPEQPWANSLLVENGIIQFVGDFEDIDSSRYSKTADLSGRFVMPGFVDAHTHPGLVALLRGGINGNGAAGPYFPSDSKESFFQALKTFANSEEYKSALDKTDLARFKELGVTASYTPHWFGGNTAGGPSEMQLGQDRVSQRRPTNSLVKLGTNVTLSSDVISKGSYKRANPFIGIEVSMTRRNFGWKKSPMIGQKSELLSLESAIAGYTLNGGIQLGRASEIGSLTASKRADFIVLPINPFDVKVEFLHTLVPDIVVMDGKVVSTQ